MEKSDTLRVNDKPNLDLVEKGNSTIPRNPGMPLTYSTVPIMQPPYYPVQPQMIQNGVPIMMNVQESGIVPNTYIINQISPNMEYGVLKNGNKNKSRDDDLCPYCKSKSKVVAKENFNYCTCCIYTIIIILIPIFLVLSLYSGCNNLNCSACSCKCACCHCKKCKCNCECKCCIDSDYVCSKCGKKMFTLRNSCHELCPWVERCIC